jgi:hypothetical protein
MVYFVQPIDGGPVKVGYSDDVAARVRQLEFRYGRPFVLLGTLPGGREEEKSIHDQFSHLRIGRTEQFRPASDLMEFIGKPLFVNASPVELMEPVKSLITMRCREEFRAWVFRVAGERRITPSQLIEFALMRYADFEKIEGPQKR